MKIDNPAESAVDGDAEATGEAKAKPFREILPPDFPDVSYGPFERNRLDFWHGNVLNQSLGALIESPAQVDFGRAKSSTLPAYCRRCEVRLACNGECPKHRFLLTPDGEEGLNYLCPAYKKFFSHIDAPMREMAALLRAGRAPAEIMKTFAPSRRPIAKDAGPLKKP